MRALSRLPTHIVNLEDRYQRGIMQILSTIIRRHQGKRPGAYLQAVKEGVHQELKLLNEYAGEWAQKHIPGAYMQGVDMSYDAFRKAKLDVGKVAVNHKVVDNLVKNATDQLTNANNFVGRRINDEIRQVGLEVVARKVMVGATVEEAQKALVKELTDIGATSILDKRGRGIPLDAYAKMVARTTTREATNIAVMNTVKDLGHDLVRMSEHNSPCPVCAVYEGRVYSISGKHPQFPPLDKAFSEGYANIHPNCIHVLTPYFPTFDKNAAETLNKSNRPFEVQPDQQKGIEDYYKDQKKKALLRQDRNAWEKAKLQDPNTPGFAKFRADERKRREAARAAKANPAAPAKVAKPAQVAKPVAKPAPGPVSQVSGDEFLGTASNARLLGTSSGEVWKGEINGKTWYMKEAKPVRSLDMLSANPEGEILGSRVFQARGFEAPTAKYGKIMFPDGIERRVMMTEGINPSYSTPGDWITTVQRRGLDVIDEVDLPKFQEMQVMDVLIGNADRHGGNFLMTGKGIPVPFDHNLAFATDQVIEKGTVWQKAFLNKMNVDYYQSSKHIMNRNSIGARVLAYSPRRDYADIITSVQSTFTDDVIKKMVVDLPASLDRKRELVDIFRWRRDNLKDLVLNQ